MSSVTQLMRHRTIPIEFAAQATDSLNEIREVSNRCCTIKKTACLITFRFGCAQQTVRQKKQRDNEFSI